MATQTTNDVNSSSIDELPQIFDGFAKLVRKGLRISAFGVQIMDLPPNHTTESHDELGTGQEELYIGLRGSGAIVLDADGQRLPLDSDHVTRVGASVARTLTSGAEGLRVLCVGGVPGKPYEAPEWTEGS